MSKTLNDILKGKKASKIETTSIGKDPGVDYKPKDEVGQKFVDILKTEKHEDRVGNTNEPKTSYTMDDPKMKNFGHKKGKDQVVYGESTEVKKHLTEVITKKSSNTKSTNEEIELVSEEHPEMQKAVDGLSELMSGDSSGFVKRKYGFGLGGSGTYETALHRVAQHHGVEPMELRKAHDKSMFPMKEEFNFGDIAKNKTINSHEEIEMVKGELKAIANKAMHALISMPEGMHVKPWVQAKVAQAKEMINSVHDHMVFGQENEDAPADTPMTFPGMNLDASGANV